MLKKDIPFKDYNGKEVTRTFWFHLSRADMATLAIGKEGKQGGFDVWLRNMMKERDGEKIAQAWEDLLLATVGERSEDGELFVKSQEVKDRFRWSPAWDILFLELLMSTDKMTEFVNGIVPADMKDEVADKMKDNPDIQDIQRQLSGSPEPAEDTRPAWEREDREPTDDELKTMTPDQIKKAFAKRLGTAG